MTDELLKKVEELIEDKKYDEALQELEAAQEEEKNNPDITKQAWGNLYKKRRFRQSPWLFRQSNRA